MNTTPRPHLQHFDASAVVADAIRGRSEVAERALAAAEQRWLAALTPLQRSRAAAALGLEDGDARALLEAWSDDSTADRLADEASPTTLHALRVLERTDYEAPPPRLKATILHALAPIGAAAGAADAPVLNPRAVFALAARRLPDSDARWLRAIGCGHQGWVSALRSSPAPELPPALPAVSQPTTVRRFLAADAAARTPIGTLSEVAGRLRASWLAAIDEGALPEDLKDIDGDQPARQRLAAWRVVSSDEELVDSVIHGGGCVERRVAALLLSHVALSNPAALERTASALDVDAPSLAAVARDATTVTAADALRFLMTAAGSAKLDPASHAGSDPTAPPGSWTWLLRLAGSDDLESSVERALSDFATDVDRLPDSDDADGWSSPTAWRDALIVADRWSPQWATRFAQADLDAIADDAPSCVAEALRAYPSPAARCAELLAEPNLGDGAHGIAEAIGDAFGARRTEVLKTRR